MDSVRNVYTFSLINKNKDKNIKFQHYSWLHLLYKWLKYYSEIKQKDFFLSL